MNVENREFRSKMRNRFENTVTVWRGTIGLFLRLCLSFLHNLHNSGLLERHKSRRLGIELSGVVEGGVKGGPKRINAHTATLSEKNLCLLPAE
jgi:hypothetical protein